MENYDIEKKALYDSIHAEENSRNTILTIMQKFAEATDEVDIDSIDKVKKFLDNLKYSLTLSNQNIEILQRLIFDMDQISIPRSYEHEFKPQEETVPQNFKEKTLIISEMSRTVLLPYKLEDVREEYDAHQSKYSSLEDVIKQKYTLPISLYKNPFVTRFRESFKLMRKKEKSSIKEAFDLGLELMFNYNLHPAIISACKCLDELDIYLDYLDTGETDKFDFFKVEFEMAPTVVKHSKKHLA